MQRHRSDSFTSLRSFGAGRAPLALAALLAAMVAMATAGCASDSTSSLEIAGTYTDEFGATHSITDDRWEQSSAFFESGHAIRSYYNGENFLVAQNDSTNLFFPDLYSRFDWATSGDDLYYCQILFNGTTEAEAVGFNLADASDLTGAGCLGFSWTLLTP